MVSTTTELEPKGSKMLRFFVHRQQIFGRSNTIKISSDLSVWSTIAKTLNNFKWILTLILK